MTSTSTQLCESIEKMSHYGKQVCQSMIEAINKLGFSDESIVDLPEFSQATFSLTTDPFTFDDNLTGTWYDQNKHRLGQIQFNSDGSFYAEYDIVKPHPTKKQWFVEGMSAWGNSEVIKTEAKLLPSLE
jgi:hypothetical protein